MEITLIIKSIMGLIGILAILIFLFFSKLKKKKAKIASKNIIKPKKEKLNIDLEFLKSIIKKKTTTTKELRETLDLVIKHHGTIQNKLGIRAHPNFKIYMNILFTICRHPNTDKDIIIDFERELSILNPTYKTEINDSITRGLNSRGI